MEVDAYTNVSLQFQIYLFFKEYLVLLEPGRKGTNKSITCVNRNTEERYIQIVTNKMQSQRRHRQTPDL